MRSLSISLMTVLLLLTSRAALAAAPPCSCLQELWVDYPGPFDLYIALVKANRLQRRTRGRLVVWHALQFNASADLRGRRLSTVR